MAETGFNLEAEREIIKINGVSKFFNLPNGAAIEAISNLSLSIYDREFVSLIGPSGCGKSTLLNIIAGLEKHDSGVIDISHPDERPARISVVFQTPLLLPWRTVWKNIQFALESNKGISRSEWSDRISRVIHLTGLEGFENAYPQQLSGGMQTRVGIARALVTDPDILLMDEPFGALDEITRRRMQTELLSIWSRDKKTIVFVTHSISEAVYLGDRIAILTPRPGSIYHELRIPLPRPRSYTDPRLFDYERIVLSKLEEAMGKQK
ncbi:MAG: ABC transporter ATP-binding protein [Candidatus Caldarchaeum sp.]